MVFFSSRISPFTSTVIFFERSPLATAVVTAAMLRTWPVRFDAIELTLSVRSAQVPATPFTSACPPSLPSVPTVDVRGEILELKDTINTMVDQVPGLAAHIDGDLLRQVAVGDGLGDVGDVAHLGRQVAGHRVDGVGEILPGAGHAANVGLAAELALGAHLAGHTRHLGGERAQLVHHRVDGVLQLQNL